MKSILMGLAALMLAACASDRDRQEMPLKAKLAMIELAEPVDRVYLPRIDSWRPVGRQHLIVYQSPSKPFLVKLRTPVSGILFDDLAIGVRRTGSHLTKFDYFLIDGYRHYVESIQPLTREQADFLS